MILKTKQKIDLTTAQAFEVIKGAEYIKKLNIFINDDCYWKLDILPYSMSSTQFNAPIVWYQVREDEVTETTTQYNEQTEQYELITNTYIKEVDIPMFEQDFILDSTMIQTMWVSLTGMQGSGFENGITPSDNYLEKVDEFVRAGILLWVGDMQGYFGLTSDDFEYID